ncbi:hypothetical protein [Cognatishimia sp. F0-27]|uniref:hypothetical protein n=1 Tax=Cognatishimia sp. F0-27 TaxID=2816855 RepID=UPI001D0C4B72|nr:hypothetical protein [Cognatishimia sp. F0-27]MCC1491054.1 hypothetical protein [Cognatishimia sp. F0-27]
MTAPHAKADDNNPIGEEIIIDGHSDWCTGIGQDVIPRQDGSNACACGAGWDEIEPENENGEPTCGYDFSNDDPIDGTPGDDGGPPPGGGQGDGGEDAPEPPTLAQCAAVNKECLRRANTLTTNCRANRQAFYNRELANGKACHGQTLETLLEGFRYRVLWSTWACTPEDFFDVTHAYTDNCRKQARIRGMGRCMHGVSGVSSSTSSGFSETRNFETPIISGGVTVTAGRSITVSTPAGVGAEVACKAYGTQAADYCAITLTNCNAEAEGSGTGADPALQPLIRDYGHARPLFAAEGTIVVSEDSGARRPAQPDALGIGHEGMRAEMFAGDGLADSGIREPASLIERPREMQTEAGATLGLAPPSLVERLSERLDHERLGLDGGLRPEQGRSGWRPAAQGALEIAPLYLLRLRMMARWSDFMRRHALSDEEQTAIETLMIAQQHRIAERDNRLARIDLATSWVDMRTGTVGAPQLEEIRDAFFREGGVWIGYARAQSVMWDTLPTLIGDAQAADFFDTVWPGALYFAYARPFHDANDGTLLANPFGE